MYTATVMRITDDQGDRCIVIHADPVIHISPELIAHTKNPDRERITGDMEITGDRIEFGTPGEGIGRVVYQLQVYNANKQWYVAERAEG